MANVISQIIATGLTVYLFALLIRWGRKDAQERREREAAARKRAWQREIERAGRRMMEQDRIKRIMQEDLHIKVPKKDPPLRKATGFYSDKDAQKFVEYKR